eukprot:3282185-Pyramimonas_sp.AAC.1
MRVCCNSVVSRLSHVYPDVHESYIMGTAYISTPAITGAVPKLADGLPTDLSHCVRCENIPTLPGPSLYCACCREI